MINSDKKKVTVDFHWTSEKEDGPAGHGGYGVFIKHHYTDEYGPTISVSETEGDYISFPSKMFAEVVDFLRAEGHIEGDKKIQPSMVQTGSIPRAVPKTALSPPVIENSSDPQEEVQNEEPPEIIIDNSNPIGSFDSNDTPYLPPETFQDAPETPQMKNMGDGLSPQEMALERQTAVDKQKSEVKSIKPSHVVEEE
ncbi:MAG: hypothetical protein HOG49_29995 [Candidatus Scalindua sp.]|jgi:hypothetical protein|nr:hypothetical protein [Candidatus Scalindua sp.]